MSLRTKIIEIHVYKMMKYVVFLCVQSLVFKWLNFYLLNWSQIIYIIYVLLSAIQVFVYCVTYWKMSLYSDKNILGDWFIASDAMRTDYHIFFTLQFSSEIRIILKTSCIGQLWLYKLHYVLEFSSINSFVLWLYI